MFQRPRATPLSFLFVFFFFFFFETALGFSLSLSLSLSGDECRIVARDLRERPSTLAFKYHIPPLVHFLKFQLFEKKFQDSHFKTFQLEPVAQLVAGADCKRAERHATAATKAAFADCSDCDEGTLEALTGCHSAAVTATGVPVPPIAGQVSVPRPASEDGDEDLASDRDEKAQAVPADRQRYNVVERLERLFGPSLRRLFEKRDAFSNRKGSTLLKAVDPTSQREREREREQAAASWPLRKTVTTAAKTRSRTAPSTTTPTTPSSTTRKSARRRHERLASMLFFLFSLLFER